MNRPQRAPKSPLHAHCESCYSRHCRKRVDVSVSCVLAQCALRCGALYHLCKAEEHAMLCPNARVPCLNAEAGCPLTVPRSCRAAHLRDCPASVVCCSMEWNRWPAEDAHAHPNVELRQNLLRDDGCPAECLDLAMSMRDQDRLFHSIRMRELFPELTRRREEELEAERRAEEARKKQREEKKRAALEKEQAEREARRARWEEGERVRAEQRAAAEAKAAEARAAAAEARAAAGGTEEEEEERELTLEEREALARGQGMSADALKKYNAWERMFNADMGGCREAGQMAAAAAAGGSGQGEVRGQGKGLGTLAEDDEDGTWTCMDNHACTSSSGMTEGGTKGFVWSGHVEPMKIISVRTFRAPTSFKARNSRGRNPWAKRESVGVDTSDLGVPLEDMPLWEEVQASLLCCLEKEQRGHLIAEASCGDTHFSDQGSQTYGFLSAPFQYNMALADLTARRPPELHLQLQVEGVTNIHNKGTCAFSFLCGHSFQRREYGQHYRNVHSDIQMSVNGWFEQRCPLSYLGCTYTQRRFQPSTQKATVHYIQELSSYSLCPVLPALLEEGSADPRSSTEPPGTQRKRAGRSRGGGTGQDDSLSSLPYEVLCHMASFLDSLSLSQLALVSHLMRDVCSSLLQDRGMVTLHWERKTYSHGGAKWRVKHKVWQFSTLFSPVDRWAFQDVPSMSEHLKVCPYYERESRTERVLLPRIRRDTHINTQCKGSSLIGLFQKDTLIM